MEYKLVEIEEYKIIIKDEEPDSYSTFLDYDIIGYGKTNEEAYKMAFENILKPYCKSMEKIREVGKLLSSEEFYLSDDLLYEWKEIEELRREDWKANSVSSDIKKVIGNHKVHTT